MGAQGHDDDDSLCRGAQPIEDRACGGAARLATLRAEEASVLTRMETNIALTDVASGWTCPVGAACRCGVHDCPPSSVGEPTKRSMSGPPFAWQAYLSTLKWGATPLREKRPISFFCWDMDSIDQGFFGLLSALG